jgi:TPP-dependent pyruvate/acetoin dehydrogenase alpha subunit
MTEETLLKLYRAMRRIRMVEEEIGEVYSEQEMRCPVHLCIGQEAIAVGACWALRPEDYVFSGHRSHGHYLAKGGDLNSMVAELYGKATGCAGGKGGSMHLVDMACGFMGAAPIVGSTIPIAVGAALASSMRGDKRVSMPFFGEGATEEGVFAESLNFAALKRLPVVFICENNGFSVYSPLSVRQPANRDLLAIARAHGVEACRGDGNDVFEVCDLAEQAVQRARAGDGPTMLEFTTYRWREHCGPSFDDSLGYRREEEIREGQARCPIARLERHLQRENILDESAIAAIGSALSEEAKSAIQFGKLSPFPDESLHMFDVYADGAED